MNRLAPQTDAAHLAAVKKYLADHLRGAPMPDVWLESLQAVIRMADNRRGDETSGRPAGGASNADSGSLPPAQPGSDTPRTDALNITGAFSIRPDSQLSSVLGLARQLERELAAAKATWQIEHDIAAKAETALFQANVELAAAKEALAKLTGIVASAPGTRWDDLPEIQRKGLKLHTAYELGHSIGLLNAIQAIDAARRAMGEKT